MSPSKCDVAILECHRSHGPTDPTRSGDQTAAHQYPCPPAVSGVSAAPSDLAPIRRPPIPRQGAPRHESHGESKTQFNTLHGGATSPDPELAVLFFAPIFHPSSLFGSCFFLSFFFHPHHHSLDRCRSHSVGHVLFSLPPSPCL